MILVIIIVIATITVTVTRIILVIKIAIIIRRTKIIVILTLVVNNSNSNNDVLLSFYIQSGIPNPSASRPRFPNLNRLQNREQRLFLQKRKANNLLFKIERESLPSPTKRK